MKLVRLKINDPVGFRSLRLGFEHVFRTAWARQEETGFAPFVCAGPNGSGKSNVLEALASIFFQLECKTLSYRPELFEYDPETVPHGYQEKMGRPDAFELEYLITTPTGYTVTDHAPLAHIKVVKEIGSGPQFFLLNVREFEKTLPLERHIAQDFLPDHVVAYSSGENEILSLPFFKMRFIQFDEYIDSIITQPDSANTQESRLVYLDQEFNQAILLCNFLFLTGGKLQPFHEEIGLERVEQFRIILKGHYLTTWGINPNFLPGTNSHAETMGTPPSHNLLQNVWRIHEKLQLCATTHFYDVATETHYLDYWVDTQCQKAFHLHFGTALELFKSFQLLLTLNLHSVSKEQRLDLYQSDSLYFNETIPTLPSDQRIMRFKDVVLKKAGVDEILYSKALSDGENQLLHTLGLCILYRDTKTLFLLDEPETHFNPDWRAKFLTTLGECFYNHGGDASDYAGPTREMLITTHAPFLISDSKPEKVLVFSKQEDGSLKISHPDFNTLGASINKITMSTFGKRETIGGIAQRMLGEFKTRFENGSDPDRLIDEINDTLGDSVEKILLIKTILDGMKSVN